MPCIAPSEFLTTPVASQFGALAESLIEADYLADVGRPAVFPVSPKDFIDFSHGFGNTLLFIAFLKSNNPKLSVSELAVLSAGGDLKLPDIMTDPPQRLEFYDQTRLSDRLCRKRENP